MRQFRTPYVQRYPGANELVTISAQSLSLFKARKGRLKNKNEHGLGISLADSGGSGSEPIETDGAYQINLHFKQEAVDQSLMPFICRESGLYIYTFDAVCKHVTPHIGEDIVVAGFEITGDIPSAVQSFLKRDLSTPAPF